MSYINSELLLSSAEHLPDKGEFKGLLSTYDVKDRNKNTFLSGSFDESLERQSSYPMLFDHDTNQVLGRIDLKPVSVGVHAHGFFNLKSARASEINDLVGMGAVTKLSIAVLAQEYVLNDEDDPYFGGKIISKADIVEGSVVVIPANPEAQIFEKSSAASFEALCRKMLHQTIEKTLERK